MGRGKGQIWAWFYSPKGHKLEAEDLLVIGAIPPHLLGLELTPGFKQQKFQIWSHSSSPVGNWTNPGACNYTNSRFLVIIPAPNPEQITLLTVLVSSKRLGKRKNILVASSKLLFSKLSWSYTSKSDHKWKGDHSYLSVDGRKTTCWKSYYKTEDE